MKKANKNVREKIENDGVIKLSNEGEKGKKRMRT